MYVNQPVMQRIVGREMIACARELGEAFKTNQFLSFH